jgi:hypothetical protein
MDVPMEPPMEEEIPAYEPLEEYPLEPLPEYPEEIPLEEPLPPLPEYPEYPAYPIEPLVDPIDYELYPEPAPIEPMPEEIVEDIPLVEEISYVEPAPMPPMDEGGYRRKNRRMVRKKVKRTFALKRAAESDLRLRFIENCRDKNPKCDFWASLTAVRKDGKVIRVNECRTNPFMRTMEGCPRACDVCTPNRVEWNLRRRNARILRRRRLAKKKNL